MEEPTEDMFALGLTNFWDTYFAGRAAALGSSVPAEVVDALFYNLPRVRWPPHPKGLAHDHTGRGDRRPSTRLRRGAAPDPGRPGRLARIRPVLLFVKAAVSAPLGGRPMYAALRPLPLPDEPVGRLFHAATMLREHRGDGHICALMAEGIGGLEAHVLLAVDMGLPARTFAGSTTSHLRC